MATVRLFRNNWCADYTDQWGRRHREKPQGKFETKAQQKRAALALLKRRLDEVDSGSYDPSSRNLKFGDLADRFLESKINIRDTTRRLYSALIELYLKPYFGNRMVHQISAADIEQFRNLLVQGRPPPIVDAFAERERNARPALSRARAKQRASQKKPGVRTINKCLTMLVMIYNYACKHRWIDHNAAELVEKLRQPVSTEADLIDSNVLTPQEINLLIDAADGPRWSEAGELTRINAKLLIRFAVLTGMRSGEIRGLQWGDIDWRSGSVHVRRAWKEGKFYQPKTAASVRRIDLPLLLGTELREWRVACPKGEYDLVFPNLNGNPLSPENLLRRQFYPALRRAGLRQIRFHDLRHTFASLLIASGEDIVRVSRLLGHANPTITLKVYSHMLPNEHYGGVERLARLLESEQESLVPIHPSKYPRRMESLS